MASPPAGPDRQHDCGPFDVVGDVHGCCDELEELLRELRYAPDASGTWRHVEGRRAVFVGDLVDRGPRIADALRLVMSMSAAGSALCVAGNRDVMLKLALEGRDLRVSSGLQTTLAALQRVPDAFRQQVKAFLDGLASHYVLDAGELVVAHAGMTEALQGRTSRAAWNFALLGDRAVGTDGDPARSWVSLYRGRAAVVHGHTPIAEPAWRNRTLNIDTGCVYGHRLTAIRWPEREIVSVRARKTYATRGAIRS